MRNARRVWQGLRPGSGNKPRKQQPASGTARAQLLIVLLVLAVVGTGCARGVPTGATTICDPTSGIGATQWTLEGQVTEQSKVNGIGTLIDVQVSDVLWTRDVYYWIGQKYDTPQIKSGSSLEILLPGPSASADMRDRSLIFVVQAAGTPEELAAGKGTHFVAVFSAHLVLDTNWNLIDARNGTLDTFREVQDLYPGQGLSRIVSLVDDAWSGYSARNETHPTSQQADQGGQGVATASVTTTTPGPLGEWRRARGCESAGQTQDVAAQLQSWMAIAPERRQLPDVAEDLLPGTEAALGVTLEERQAVIVVDKSVMSDFTWAGLRVPGVGIVGPYFIDPSGVVGIDALFPGSHNVEVVAWAGDTVKDLADAQVLGTLSPATWSPGKSLWIDAARDKSGQAVVTAEAMTDTDFQHRLTDTLAARG